jgi:hypothetical protein
MNTFYPWSLSDLSTRLDFKHFDNMIYRIKFTSIVEQNPGSPLNLFKTFIIQEFTYQDINSFINFAFFGRLIQSIDFFSLANRMKVYLSFLILRFSVEYCEHHIRFHSLLKNAEK